MLIMLDTIFERGFISFCTLLVATAVTCFLLNSYAKRVIKRMNRKHPGRETTNRYLNLTVRFLIWFVGALVIVRQIKPLQALGDMLLGATGVLAVGASIAAQTSLGNYIAGLSLAIHQPFKVGDNICLQGNDISGKVTDITFRHTIIETDSGTTLTIPNTIINAVAIEDISSVTPGPLKLKLPAHTDLDKLKAIVADTLEESGIPAAADTPDITVERLEEDVYSVSISLGGECVHEEIERKKTVLPKLRQKLKENEIEIL